MFFVSNPFTRFTIFASNNSCYLSVWSANVESSLPELPEMRVVGNSGDSASVLARTAVRLHRVQPSVDSTAQAPSKVVTVALG
jgi:hypothetical protein